MIFENLVLMITLKCNASCSFCCVNSGPLRKEKMALSDAFSYIEQASKISSFKRISLTGGEPLLYIDDVLQILSKAKSFGFPTSIISNGFWGTSKEEAKKIIQKLINAGLSYMNISCDLFHQEYIPKDRIENVLAALKDLDFPATIAYTKVPGYEDVNDYISFSKYSKLTIYQGPIVPVGRGSDISVEKFSTQALVRPEMLGTCVYNKTLTINPDGKVFPCCAVGGDTDYIALGNAKSQQISEFISEANGRTFLKIIERKGADELIKIIKKYDNKFKVENRYVTICHLCDHLSNNVEIRDRMDAALEKYEIDLLLEVVNKIEKKNRSNITFFNLLGMLNLRYGFI